MERKADKKIDRHPRQVEKCHGARAGQKGAHGIEIAQRLQGVAAISGLERNADDGIVNALAQRFVEAVADPHKNAAANEIENAEADVEASGEDHEYDQRRHAAA